MGRRLAGRGRMRPPLRGKRAKAYARRNGFPVLTIAEIAEHLGAKKIAA